MTKNDLEQLRSAHGVVPVSAADEGRSWAKIANGVYGFSYSPASADCGLFMRQPLQCFEMHKLADGNLLIVGYTTADMASKLESKAAQDIEMYPDSRGEYSQLASIPYSRIASAKALDRDDFNKLKVSLRPID
jgi:hypothetical protein